MYCDRETTIAHTTDRKVHRITRVASVLDWHLPDKDVLIAPKLESTLSTRCRPPKSSSGIIRAGTNMCTPVPSIGRPPTVALVEALCIRPSARKRSTLADNKELISQRFIAQLDAACG